MVLSPFFRKLGLTAHITFSVGWFGAVAAFLALAIAGLTSENAQVVASCYISMELVTWFVIVPACAGTLGTGIFQSLLTQWGLFRYYWIVAKFLLTVVATIVLLLHLQPISIMADAVSGNVVPDLNIRALRVQLLADAGAALLMLLVTTTISVYKPWGMTGYGKRKLNEQGKRVPDRRSINKPWLLYVLLGLIALVILMFIGWHLAGGGLGHQ